MVCTTDSPSSLFKKKRKRKKDGKGEFQQAAKGLFTTLGAKRLRQFRVDVPWAAGTAPWTDFSKASSWQQAPA